MSLTPAQLATLKADIEANPDLNSIPNTLDGAYAISDLYGLNAVPDFTVWRTFVDRDEVMLNGFDWTRVDNLSVGKARCWEWMMDSGGFDPSKSNIRAGIDAVWVGTAADLAVRAAVYVHCKRLANRGEKLFATGTGSNADPATMTIQGVLDPNDIHKARNLP